MYGVMGVDMSKLKPLLAAILCAGLAFPAGAQEAGPDLDELFGALRAAPNEEAAKAVEAKIWAEWSKSGSAALDLLLQRGREALEAGDSRLAVAHFSALIDHAPDFAEGWNMRATAYYQDGRYGQSLEDIRQTLMRNPRHFGALTGLATILEQIGEDAAALEAWRAVAELKPVGDDVEEAIERLERRVMGQTL